MKVLMVKDVAKVGQKGTIKDISDGYALNFLIPQGLAVQATPEKVKEAAARENALAAQNAEREKAFRETVQILDGIVLEIPVKANAKGHLYQQLMPGLIVKMLRENRGIEIPVEAVALKEPIKTTGEHTIEARLGAAKALFTLLLKNEG